MQTRQWIPLNFQEKFVKSTETIDRANLIDIFNEVKKKNPTADPEYLLNFSNSSAINIAGYSARAIVFSD